MSVRMPYVIFASIVPFLLSLRGDFVFDDSEAIVKNKDVFSGSWLNAFSNDFWGTNIKSNLSHKSYRPLTILSFRLNYILSKKLSATEFKATNLVCHMVCCILVWMTYECIWKRVKIKSIKGIDVPFQAALLFCVHPVHVEAVCGVVGRADLLSAITFFTSFLLYDNAVKNKSLVNIHLYISIILAGISMLFKENGITVLGFCCVYDIVISLKKRATGRLPRSCIYRISSVILCAMLLLYARWSVMGGTAPQFKPSDNPAAFSNDLFTKILNYNYIYFMNLLLLLWPQWLCYDWSMGCIPLIKTILDFRILFVISMYLFAVLFIISIIKRESRTSENRLKLLAISLLVIPFLPAANILYPVGFVIAERILYIPSAGYCLFFAIGVYKIAQFNKEKSKLANFLYSSVLWFYVLRSCQRSFAWQNEYSLFTDALSVCPLNAKVHYNIAKVADANNDSNWALSEYKEAIRLYPEYYQAMNNLANLLKNKKIYTEAEYYLRSALHYKKDFPAAWMNLGIVLAHTRRFNESLSAYKNAIRYRKYYPDCYYNLGNLYLDLNKTKEATENWLQAINLNPKHESAWTNLIALLYNTGQTTKALEIIPKALQELPKTPQVNFAIGNIYGKIDKYEQAEEHFLKAIDLFKDRVQAIHYANLGVLYHRWKKIDLAEKMYKMALKLDAKFPSALKNLKNLENLKKKQ